MRRLPGVPCGGAWQIQKDTVKDWERATLLCDQIRIDADAALAVVNDLPSGMAEDAANLLCEALTEARAQVLAWANDNGEP